MKKSERMTREQILALMKPFSDDFGDCLFGAWDDWQNDLRFKFPTITERGFANVLYEKIIERAKNRFSNYPTPVVHMSIKHNSLKLTLGEGLIVRFKKFNGGLGTSNYPTMQAVLFDRQAFLPVFGSVDRVNVGYQTDPLRTKIDCFITYPLGKGNIWVEPVMRNSRIGLLPVNTLVTPNLPFRPKEMDAQGQLPI